MKRTLLVAVFAVVAPALAAAQVARVSESQVDRVFARWTNTTPGCGVGVSVNGRPVLQRAYGMADLEHGVANTPATIFESGSIAKQFTAAAVLLLAREGKLSLDDPVRHYVPEIPDYGVPLTIRHMLNHTSGLRDWGNVAGIGGWPRGTRAYTQAHVIDILSRQQALNFKPGTHYSYSNSGYNLAAVIVSRVSGMPFAEFTRRRIFEPAGMRNTSWRDDFARIVKRRAIAYSPQGGDGWRQEMPFENAHGNGGMLTTIEDLLTWTNNFAAAKVADAAFFREMTEPGRFNDGRPHGYALGLQVGTYRGVREIAHGGATAGYRTQLSLYPDQGVAVVVLCNASNATPAAYANAVVDLYLANTLTASPEPAPAPRAASAPIGPSAEQLQEYIGSYTSDEAETSMTAALEDGGLVLKRRPATTIRLTPAEADVFTAGTLGRITFRRDANGRVSAFSVTQDRVWDLRFEREASAAGTARN